MANPQKENGYTPIANDILEALARTKLRCSDRQILDVIIRRTYGFRKKEDAISLSQFKDATNIDNRSIIYSIQNLEAKNMIEVVKKDYETNIYIFNKDYDTWVVQRNSKQYVEMLNQKKEKYRNRVVQRIEKGGSAEKKTDVGVVQRNAKSSAEKPLKVVQRNAKKVQFSAHTKEKRNTKETKERERVASAPTPKEETKNFFEGVKDLLEKKPVPWLSEMLTNLAERNPNVDKRKIWAEVVAFCGYWTERDQEGRQEKWQLQKTFEVWKRLYTWFRRANFKDFQGDGQPKNKGRGLVE